MNTRTLMKVKVIGLLVLEAGFQINEHFLLEFQTVNLKQEDTSKSGLTVSQH